MFNNPETNPNPKPAMQFDADFYDMPEHQHFMRISDTKMGALFSINDEQWSQLLHGSNTPVIDTTPSVAA